MTTDELNSIPRRNPDIKIDGQGVWIRPSHGATRTLAAVPEHTEGITLDSPVSREGPRGHGSPKRYRITFTVFAVRPCDWDNYHIKEIQDWLVELGFLPGDGWSVLLGEVIPEKVHSKAEERTEIEIYEL